MANTYTVTITNGTGTTTIIEDTYAVTADVTGYDNTTITPTSITYDGSTSTYNFTIAAKGTLTLHVTEDGTSSGTPIVGAIFYRTDSTGTQVGGPYTTDTNGDATIPNVPYSTGSAPTIYYQQTASDGAHSFNSAVQNITMTQETQTIEIENTPPQQVTLTLNDANYPNIPIASGTITLN